METQPRSTHPRQHGPGHCHWGILLTTGYFWGQKGLWGAVWQGAVSAAARALTCSWRAVWAAPGGMSPSSQAETLSALQLSQKIQLPTARLPESGHWEQPGMRQAGRKVQGEETSAHSALFAFLIPCICGWPKASLLLRSALGMAGQDPGSRSHPSPGGDKAATVNYSTTYQKRPP